MLIGMGVAAVLHHPRHVDPLGDDLLVLLTSMLNPLPSIAILPLAILWFGLSETALIIVIANAVTWPIAINVSTGFRTVNPTILAVGRNIGLRGWRLVRDVLLPAALPHTISGLKTGWAFGWRTIIAAELVFGVAGGGGGLGNYINDARYFLQIPEVFAGLVTIARDRHRPRLGVHPDRAPDGRALGHEGVHARRGGTGMARRTNKVRGLMRRSRCCSPAALVAAGCGASGGAAGGGAQERQAARR